MNFIVKKKSSKEEDTVEKEDSKDTIETKKVYKYNRQYINSAGETKTYIHKVVAPKYEKTVPDWVHILNEELNKLIMSGTQLNKINRVKNTVLRNRCYNKRNMVQQLSKAEALGEVSKKTKELMELIFEQQYKMAGTIEESLFNLLTLLKHEQERVENINKELKQLDSGELDE